MTTQLLWAARDGSGYPYSFAVMLGDRELAVGLSEDAAKRIVLSHNVLAHLSLDALERWGLDCGSVNAQAYAVREAWASEEAWRDAVRSISPELYAIVQVIAAQRRAETMRDAPREAET